jgi:hypothetical protein
MPESTSVLRGGLVMDEATIRQKIQEKLQRGALPIHAQAAPEASIYSNVGEGTGDPCSAVMTSLRHMKSA